MFLTNANEQLSEVHENYYQFVKKTYVQKKYPVSDLAVVEAELKRQSGNYLLVVVDNRKKDLCM